MLMVQAERQAQQKAFICGAAVGLGLWQRYDLHLGNKKRACLRLSHLHLCCATMENSMALVPQACEPPPALHSSHFLSCWE